MERPPFSSFCKRLWAKFIAGSCTGRTPRNSLRRLGCLASPRHSFSCPSLPISLRLLRCIRIDSSPVTPSVRYYYQTLPRNQMCYLEGQYHQMDSLPHLSFSFSPHLGTLSLSGRPTVPFYSLFGCITFSGSCTRRCRTRSGISLTPTPLLLFSLSTGHFLSQFVLRIALTLPSSSSSGNLPKLAGVSQMERRSPLSSCTL